MRINFSVHCAVGLAILNLTACVSSRPRPYAPNLRPPPVDQAAFEDQFEICADAVSRGERNFSGSTSAAVVGTVGSVAAVQTLSGVAATAAVGSSAGLAATGVGLLAAVPIATYSLSSAKRRKNESQVKSAMTDCLASQGYAVSSWSRQSPSDASTLNTVTPTRQAKPNEG